MDADAMRRISSALAIYELWCRATRNRQVGAAFGLHLALQEALVAEQGPALESHPSLMDMALRQFKGWRVGGLSFPVKAWEVRESALAARCLGRDEVARRLTLLVDLLALDEFGAIPAVPKQIDPIV